MKQNIRIRAAIIIAVALLCVHAIIGFPTSKDHLISNLKENVRLGLDLSGGMQIVVEAQLQDVFRTYADSTIAAVKEELSRCEIACGSVHRNDSHAVAVAHSVTLDLKGIEPTRADALRHAFSSRFPEWVVTALNSTDYRLTMTPASVLNMTNDIMARSVATIDRRLKGFGFARSVVRRLEGSGNAARLLIQFPPTDNAAHVKELLQARAVFEIVSIRFGPLASREEARAQLRGDSTLDAKLVPAVGIAGRQSWYVVSYPPLIRAAEIRDAHAASIGQGRWETEFVVTPEAERRFREYHDENPRNRSAIVIDGGIIGESASQSMIGNTGRIPGAVTQEEALDLALNLRSGPLPVRLMVLEENTVELSGAQASRLAGIRAGIGGFVFLAVGLLLYYGHAAFNAILALTLNALIIVAILSNFGVTLTLLGIAGVVVALGVGVGCNVLMLERIREELRDRKEKPAALDAGFRKSFPTIVDIHATGLISSVFLFIFPAGPSGSFAVSLMIGLIVNVLTSTFVLKTLLDLESSRLGPSRR